MRKNLINLVISATFFINIFSMEDAQKSGRVEIIQKEFRNYVRGESFPITPDESESNIKARQIHAMVNLKGVSNYTADLKDAAFDPKFLKSLEEDLEKRNLKLFPEARDVLEPKKEETKTK